MDTIDVRAGVLRSCACNAQMYSHAQPHSYGQYSSVFISSLIVYMEGYPSALLCIQLQKVILLLTLEQAIFRG